MQVEVGVPLIIVGFLTPIVIFLLYRRAREKRLKKIITQGQGEVFDRECERVGIVEDGKQYKILIPRLQMLEINNNSLNNNSTTTLANGGGSSQSISQNTSKKFSGKSINQQFEITYFFEDPSLKRLKIIPNVQDIQADLGLQMSDNKSQDDLSNNNNNNNNNNLSPLPLPLEAIPEEEEKNQDKSSVNGPPPHNEHQTPSKLILNTNENNRSPSAMKNHNNGDRSLVIQADLSEIICDEFSHPKKTPSFAQKGVVNFYDDASEDLSILKDIISQRSQSNAGGVDTSQVSQKQPQIVYKSSPFKHHNPQQQMNLFHNMSNIQDKSTDCLNSVSQQGRILQYKSLHLNTNNPNNKDPHASPHSLSQGDESSLDMAVFDERILNTIEKRTQNRQTVANKQQDMTKKLFKKQRAEQIRVENQVMQLNESSYAISESDVQLVTECGGENEGDNMNDISVLSAQQQLLSILNDMR